MIGVTLGTGVGGGLILDGAIYRGYNSLAGEIGQMSIDFRGKDGPYGNFGAVERYVGHHRVCSRAQARYAEAGHPRSQAECTPERVAAAAASGDPVAIKLWQDVARELATALAAIVWLLNPEKVVVGGGMSRAGDVLFVPLRKSLESQLDRPFLEGFELLPARFGPEAGVVGTALLAADAAIAGAA
jgi:glucokinase